MLIKHSNNSPKKIATILDKPMESCLRHECMVMGLNEDNWQDILINGKPELLLVESALYNNINLSIPRTNPNVPYDNTLEKVIGLCKENDIPTVFWNTHDPEYFDFFIGAAGLFDYVFTIDSNCIPKYEKVLGHQNVYLLPHAVQPIVHNPIGRGKERLGLIAFEGVWPGISPQSVKELEMLLKPAKRYGLHIYESKEDIKNKSSRFPPEYKQFVKGCLTYEQAASQYKKFDMFLAVSATTTSSTVFPKKICELLACGTNVISCYSPAIENTFPEIVKLCSSESDVTSWLNTIEKNRDLMDKLSILGQREIFGKHTYAHRLDTILQKTLPDYTPFHIPLVTVITCTNRPNYIENVFANYERQNYANKELIVILNNNSMVMSEWECKAEQYSNVRIFQLDENKTLGECLNFAVSQSNGRYVAKFDDDDYYGIWYIVDNMNAFLYSRAGVVGKYTYYTYFESSKKLTLSMPQRENCYERFLAGGTLFFDKNVFNSVNFSHISLGEDADILKKCYEKEIKVYSGNRFNYVYIRHMKSSDHTWKIEDDNLLNICTFIAATDNYVPFTTI